jgi:hypothetical protein
MQMAMMSQLQQLRFMHPMYASGGSSIPLVTPPTVSTMAPCQPGFTQKSLFDDDMKNDSCGSSTNGETLGGADGRRKRSRVFIDPLSEIPRLEQWFKQDSHPSSSTIERLTDELNRSVYRQRFPKLDPKNVQLWFKNHRAKVKRQSLECSPVVGVSPRLSTLPYSGGARSLMPRDEKTPTVPQDVGTVEAWNCAAVENLTVPHSDCGGLPSVTLSPNLSNASSVPQNTVQTGVTPQEGVSSRQLMDDASLSIDSCPTAADDISTSTPSPSSPSVVCITSATMTTLIPHDEKTGCTSSQHDVESVEARLRNSWPPVSTPAVTDSTA